MIDPKTRAQVLTEALPYLRRYAGQTLVIKYGGAAMVDEALKEAVMQDVVLLHYVGLRPVLVHGGGPEITEAMKKTGKQPTFIDGLRVTDQETVEIVEMVLAGKTNKGIVSLLQRQGGKAVGLSGKDGDLIVAERLRPKGVDIGYVGEITAIHPELLEILAREGYIPVISSVAVGPDGETLNINADHVAGRIAGELKAEKLLLLTDVAGILADKDDPATLISEMGAARARSLITTGAVDKGMIPKVEACLMALEGGVPRAHILDGRTPHALLTEIFTDTGVGTMIVGGTDVGS
jgi:acetylglutamate kinase